MNDLYLFRNGVEYIPQKRVTHRLLALSTETVATLEAGDFQLISIVDETIGALRRETLESDLDSDLRRGETVSAVKDKPNNRYSLNRYLDGLNLNVGDSLQTHSRHTFTLE